MSDGRPVPEPFAVENLEIYPGERFTVLISPLPQMMTENSEFNTTTWSSVITKTLTT